MTENEVLEDGVRPDGTKRKRNWFLIGFVLCVDSILVTGAILLYVTWPPANQYPHTVNITPGSTASEIADLLEQEKIVKSANMLYATLVLFEDPSNIKAGAHVFTKSQNTLKVAHFISTNIPEDELIAVTFPEGFTHFEFNDYLPSEITPIASDTAAYEGLLFPDTYLVPADYTADDLLNLMQTTQKEKIAPLASQITASSFSETEILTLASIIEREANDDESMHLVSGILHNRLEIGMPLQVDASVAYGLGISGTDLTRSHIETDGPYNTYTRGGLPPTPIANPGLVAIEAVLNPTPSEYLFYITGNDGNFYYAETLNQHNQNIARYLR